MFQNIGSFDRIVRLSIGVLLLLIGWYSRSGMLVLAGMFALYEGLASWCIVYQVLGINTCPLKQRNTLPSGKILLRIFIQGVAILFLAIFLNIFATMIGWYTWYEFLRSPTKVLSFDNYVFLLVLYPLGLGIGAEMVRKMFPSK